MQSWPGIRFVFFIWACLVVILHFLLYFRQNLPRPVSRACCNSQYFHINFKLPKICIQIFLYQCKTSLGLSFDFDAHWTIWYMQIASIGSNFQHNKLIFSRVVSDSDLSQQVSFFCILEDCLIWIFFRIFFITTLKSHKSAMMTIRSYLPGQIRAYKFISCFASFYILSS